MMKDIYDPLTEYINVFRGRFKDVAEATFAELAKEAQVDIEANHETCRQLYAVEDVLSSVETNIGRWTTWCVLLWLGVVGGIIVAFALFQELESWILVIIGVYILIATVLLFMKV